MAQVWGVNVNSIQTGINTTPSPNGLCTPEIASAIQEVDKLTQKLEMHITDVEIYLSRFQDTPGRR
jgi:hypothetical protein